MKKLAVVLVFLSIGFLPVQVQAEEKLEVKKEVYIYTSEGRRDPFLSIIAAAKKAKEERKVKRLIPVEDYDVSQFKLIAIMWDEKQYYALVGLPDGKYYTLKEDMPVGIHGGKVKRITENAVIVREFIRDYKGRLRPQDTVLKLREEEVE
jgi:type IV pilus assembly protein PilP